MADDPFFIPQTLRDSIVAMAALGDTIDAMCQRMADEHLEKIAAIKLLREATHSSLSQAKATVHRSAAYADRCTSDDEFHQTALSALEGDKLFVLSSPNLSNSRAS